MFKVKDYGLDFDIELIDSRVRELKTDTGVSVAVAIAELLKAKAQLIGIDLGVQGAKMAEELYQEEKAKESKQE